MPTIFFLHGWGCDGSIFLNIALSLKFLYCCVLVDFPPQKTNKKDEVWTLDDYANMINFLKNKICQKNIAIIAHSFGGRVALRMASCYNYIDKMILVASAGIIHKTIITRLKIVFFKIFKKYLDENKYASADYKLLSTQMKKTFINIVNTNQIEDCKKIKTPTLLIFGERDKQIPLSSGKKMHKLIKNSKLIIYKKASHYCFLEKVEDFFADIIEFFNKEKK